MKKADCSVFLSVNQLRTLNYHFEMFSLMMNQNYLEYYQEDRHFLSGEKNLNFTSV